MSARVFIPLTQGQVAIIDIEDYEKVKHHKWHADRTSTNKFYARSRINGRDIRIHRFLTNPLNTEEVDHKDGNSLNNCRNNLRVCTHLENMKNMSLKKNNTSGHTGVYFSKERNKWQAQITKNGKVMPLGRFKIKEEAINAYETAAKETFGEYKRSA